jgi:4,5-DOPA dioxygenase extradiol
MSGGTNSEHRAQVVYFSHGGGPLPILGDPSHKAMMDFMRKLPSQLRRPDAIVVISAHWEEAVVTLIGTHNPPMLYDYYGFPPEAYQITYPAPGDPSLAKRIAERLRAGDIPSRIDTERGFDHGLFIPLKMMYPQADIPSIQISLLRSLEPSEHIALGKALGYLLGENVLVVGSGFSFHNLMAFSWDGVAESDPRNDAFQQWLIEVCTGSTPQHEREQRLVAWEKAPSARYCHPRAEHLLPLHVCVGLAAKPGKVVFDEYILGKRAVAFLWQ